MSEAFWEEPVRQLECAFALVDAVRAAQRLLAEQVATLGDTTIVLTKDIDALRAAVARWEQLTQQGAVT